MNYAVLERISSFENSLSWRFSKNLLIIGSSIAGLYLAGQVYTVYKKSLRRKKWASVEKNTVVLHQLERGKFTPSISPFPLKLETFLRMSDIPYESDFEEPMGPKGKTPWITLNGEEIADSQLCLELLARKFHKNHSAHLSPEDQAVARSLQIMAEEHLYWALALWRWVYTSAKTVWQIQSSFPWTFRLLAPLISKEVKSQAYKQGLGRHSEAEVIETGVKDLRAISVYLGSKPFIMGDKPVEADCAIFGILAQCYWNAPGSPFEQLINGEFVNLKHYCERMRETFWPDWDRCINPPKIPSS